MGIEGFEIKKITINPKYESRIPNTVTAGIIERLDKPIKYAGSSMVEGFIADKLQEETNEDQISSEFVTEGFEQKTVEYLDAVTQIAGEIDWGEILSEDNLANIKRTIGTKMADFGCTNEQIKHVLGTNITFTNEFGKSTAGNNQVFVDLLQSTRKAIDLGVDEQTFPNILETLVTSTVAHELGHIVDESLGGISWRIPNDPEWVDDSGESGEQKNERFAEYWATLVSGDQEVLLRQESAEQVARVNNLWQKIAEYNKTHTRKIDLLKVFGDIEGKVNNVHVKTLVEARKLFYANAEPESYASPYNEETIRDVIQMKNKEL
jgi:hypothetical protein